MSMGGSSDNSYSQLQGETQALMQSAYTEGDKIAGEGVDWADDFFNTYIKDELTRVTASADTASERLTNIYDTQQDLYNQREDFYRAEGAPAIKNYLDTARDFSTDSFAEGMASRASGDIENASLNQQGALDRGLAARGVAAGSPAALAAMGDNGLQTALAKASAASRARDVAMKMGLDLKTGAAGVGLELGKLSAPITGQMAGTAGQDVATSISTLGSAVGAGGLPLAARTAALDYFGNKGKASGSLYGSATKGAADEDAANSEGWGKLAGTVIAAAPKMMALSDRRKKRDIKKIGERPDGLNVYSFRYKDRDGLQVGVMADEVEKIYPHAVSEVGGFKYVDYAALSPRS